MGILRKIEKDEKFYLRLITEDQETAREHCKEYIAHIQNSQEILEDYIESKGELFNLHCEESIKVFDAPVDTFLMRMVRSFAMWSVNRNLNKISKDISKAKMLERKLDKIRIRFEQYQYLKERTKKK